MSTPIRKEFGPGYDYPNRKFHFWAVILPTVVLVALAVALMRDTASTSSKLTRSPIVTCPKQMCPAPGSTGSAKTARDDVGGRIERSADYGPRFELADGYVRPRPCG